MEAAGTPVEVSFEGQGVDDEDYKTQLALDLGSGEGPDVMSIDGIWVGEFATAEYIRPLDRRRRAGGRGVGRLGPDQRSGAGQRDVRGRSLRHPAGHRRPGHLLQQGDLRRGRPARGLAAGHDRGGPRGGPHDQGSPARRHPDPAQRRRGDGRGDDDAGRPAAARRRRRAGLRRGDRPVDRRHAGRWSRCSAPTPRSTATRSSATPTCSCSRTGATARSRRSPTARSACSSRVTTSGARSSTPIPSRRCSRWRTATRSSAGR